jgi:hypothetical protein
MIDDIEKLFNESEHPFVTVIANGKTLGNYCTKSYQDMDRLYNDMNRHDIAITDIHLEKIKVNTIPDEEALSEKIKKLNKELGDAHSRYHSALVAKQADDFERYQFVQKKEDLEDFVDVFNSTHNDNERMELVKINRTKWVLSYKYGRFYRLKRSISFYNDLDLDAIRNGIALYHQLPEQFKERFFIENGALKMTELFYIITVKSSQKPDYFDIIFQMDKEDDPIITTVTKENLFDAISKYIRN